LLAQIADAIDTTIGGRIYLNNVERVTSGDLTALLALVARFAIFRVTAIDGFGEQAGGAGLASSSRPGKEVGMCQFTGGQRIFERANDLRLTDQIVKVL